MRTEDSQMKRAIRRAVRSIRAAVEREVTQAIQPLQPIQPTAHGRLTIMLDDNRLSQQQREILERPENDLRPVQVREYWRPPGVEDDELPEELARESLGRRARVIHPVSGAI